MLQTVTQNYKPLRLQCRSKYPIVSGVFNKHNALNVPIKCISK